MLDVNSSETLDRITDLLRSGTMVGLSDGDLLARFRRGEPSEAEAAFAALVDRHGPMVFRVCRRIMTDSHDAEDAAQATFLVLARRAGAIRREEAIASWLHGVALKVATQARRDVARRRVRERSGGERSSAMVGGDSSETDGEAARILHEEIERLPERLRLPLLLFHFEGLAYDQVAQRVGCPVRTVQSRLVRARQLLRDRLTRRGVAPSVTLAIPVSGRDAVAVLVSDGWKLATIRTSVLVGAGGASGVVSARVVSLTQEVLKSMVIHRVLGSAAFASLIGLAVGGVGVALSARSSVARDEQAVPVARDENSRFRITLEGGCDAEVIAVSTVPTGPRTWWKPDGTPLAEAPVDAIMPSVGAKDGETARVILVRASGVKRDDFFRWKPTPPGSHRGGRARKGDRDVPGLEYYEATFPGDSRECGIQVRSAAGPWKTEVTNEGKGGFSQFVGGHKFTFSKARPIVERGRAMTAFTVAHNFFGQDRRLVAIDRAGAPHPAVSYSMGSDGDPRWMIDLIDGEFPLPPEEVKEFQVQFRPLTITEVAGIRLNPQPEAGSTPR